MMVNIELHIFSHGTQFPMVTHVKSYCTIRCVNRFGGPKSLLRSVLIVSSTVVAMETRQEQQVHENN